MAPIWPLSLFSSSSGMLSADNSSSPMEISAPTIFLTMLYRKLLPLTLICTKPSARATSIASISRTIDFFLDLALEKAVKS